MALDVAAYGRRVLSSRSMVIALLMAAALVVPAVFAPVLAPYDPNTQFRGMALAGPSAQHWFGTDQLGRDVLTRMLYGMRVSLVVAAGGVTIGAVVGTVAGLVAAYLGSWWDLIFMRASDVILAFPTVLIGIVVAVVYGRGFFAILVAVAIYNVPTFARLTRSRVLELRELDYVGGARAIGAGKLRVMFSHLLPNAMPPVFVQFGVAVGFAVFLESALSFLGLGVQAPVASLGQMLGDARRHLRSTPLYGIVPGLAITLMIVTANLLTDAIRDIWNE